MTVISGQWSVVSKTLFRVALCVLLFALCFSAHAQPLRKIPRVGYVSGSGEPSDPGPYVEAFRQGLRERGYVEGQNILVEYRYAVGKMDVPTLVSELLQLNVDVLVATNFPAIRAAKEATKTIPVVMVATVDPVATGIVASLAQPGGNITGLTRLTQELSGKRLELLTEALQRIPRVGVLWDANSSSAAIAFKEYETVARALKMQLQSLEIRGPNPNFESAFQAAAKKRIGALITVRNSVLNRYPKQIANLAIKNRLPSMSEGSDYVEAGGLVSYSANDAESYRRAATYVDKILKGAKPGELPVEQPTKFELVINLKTAKALNLTIPQSVLYRADKVIK